MNVTDLLADSASRVGPHITLNNIVLDWTLDRIALQTGLITSQYLLGLRGVRINDLDLLITPSPNERRKIHMDLGARGIDLDLPLSPEEADVKAVVEGIGWGETNQLLSDALDNWFLGQTATEVSRELTSALGDRLRATHGRVIFDRIDLTSPQVSVNGTSEVIMFGALFPFAVIALAGGYPHESGGRTGDRYVFDLGRNGTLILNGEAIKQSPLQ